MSSYPIYMSSEKKKLIFKSANLLKNGYNYMN